MSEIPLNRFGRIRAGESEGYFLHVHFDRDVTGGFYVYLVDDLENPSDGGDSWARDEDELATLFRTSEWKIEWLEGVCVSCASPGT
ncbi:hypothetical protein [Micromonospora sp. NPDC005979]|uniref:hypothetical protein n=1 Tax=Micromonospora sp. NPDC005979 TaxID=3156726 RepID=UPI0033B0B96C